MRERSAPSTRADFPAIPAGWAYLDTAATAQKPQAVIDAITRGYAETYATVHRGVYQRSADMTLAYEAARGGSRGSSAPRPTRSSSSAARPRGSTSSRRAGRGRISRPATASCFRRSSIIQQHRALADGRRAHRRRDRRRAADRGRPHRPRRDGGDAHAGAQARRAGPCLERARLGARRAARGRDRASGRREAPARRLPGGAADGGRRRGDRLRFLRLLRPQALRPDRDRRAVGAAPNCSTRCRRGRAAAR